MTEQAPVQFFVAAFQDEQGADEALKELKQAKREKLIGIEAAAVVRRDQKNKLHVKEVGELTSGKGAVGGALLGVALAIITGGAGLLLGAVGALVGGIIGKRHDAGFPNERLKIIGDSLTPGTSAIVAVIEHRWVVELQQEMEELGADVMTAAIAADIHETLARGMDLSYSAVASEEGVAMGRTAVGAEAAEMSEVVVTDESITATEAIADAEGMAYRRTTATDEGVLEEAGVISEEGAVLAASFDDGEEITGALLTAVPEEAEALEAETGAEAADEEEETAA